MVFKKIFERYYQKKIIKQFTRFCIIGATAALINFSIYYSFTEWLGFWYINSGILAFIISAVFNFSANKFWTFENKEIGREIFWQLLKYSMVMVSGLLINTVILFVLTDITGFDYRLSWVFATGIVTFWNFSFNSFWTFKVKDGLA